MKITQASIQTLAILGTATATNAASLRGAKDDSYQMSRPFLLYGDSSHPHEGQKRTRDPDHMVAYKASQSSLVPPAVASSHPHEGQKRTRDPDYMLAYKDSQSLVPPAVGSSHPHEGQKRTRDPDHMVAYKASQSSLVPPAVASSRPHEGQKRTRDPDYMVAYAASEAADRVSKRARIGDGNSKGQPEQSHAAIPGWGQN